VNTNETESVWRVLNRNLFFVRDAVKRSTLKTSDKFDVFDPETQQAVLECREPEIGGLTKIGRSVGGHHDAGSSFDYFAKLPDDGPQVFRMARGNTSLTLGNIPVAVFDHGNELIGKIKKQAFAIGLKFEFAGNRGNDSFGCEIKSNLLGNDFRLLIGDKEVAHRTSKWKATHAEFYKQGKFTYAISVAPDVPVNKPIRQLILAIFVGLGRIRN
jgi:hypothetical protein